MKVIELRNSTKCILFFIAILLLNINQAKANSVSVKRTSSDSTRTPSETILLFLNWYKEVGIKTNYELVNNSLVQDSTMPYSVNFDETERFLNDLLNTQLISLKYVNSMRKYFIECDKNFKDSPEFEGPPSGFDFDLILHSQDYDDDLLNLDKIKFKVYSKNRKEIKIIAFFPFGGKLIYTLSKYKSIWKIDAIETEYSSGIKL